MGRTQPLLRVRAWPLELVNGVPLEPDLIVQHVDELRSQVEPGLFRSFDPAALPGTSFPAFELVAAAYTLDDVAGEQVSLAVRDALFEDGRDVSNPSVLAEIGQRYGVPDPGPDAHRSVLADYDAGKRLGVRGSPEYFLDGRGYFCPALRIQEIGGKLEIESAPEAFDAFVEECFH